MLKTSYRLPAAALPVAAIFVALGCQGGRSVRKVDPDWKPRSVTRNLPKVAGDELAAIYWTGERIRSIPTLTDRQKDLANYSFAYRRKPGVIEVFALPRKIRPGAMGWKQDDAIGARFIYDLDQKKVTKFILDQ
jgi:hypothetical protein